MQKMADTQDMTQLITQAGIESIKATLQEMSVRRTEAAIDPRIESIGVGPKISFWAIYRTLMYFPLQSELGLLL